MKLCFKGDALSCRASPLPKQSTGLFWNSPLAERTMYEDFALCGERRGRRPRPASFFYEKKLDQKTCLLSGFESLHRTLNFVLSEQTNNKIMPRSNLICFGAKLLYQHRIYAVVLFAYISPIRLTGVYRTTQCIFQAEGENFRMIHWHWICPKAPSLPIAVNWRWYRNI